MVDITRFLGSGLIILSSISIVSALAYFAFFKTYKKKYVLFWSLSWALHGLRYVFDYISFKYLLISSPPFLMDLSVILSTRIFQEGFYNFLDDESKSQKAIHNYLSIACVVWSFLLGIILQHRSLASIPVFIYTSYVLITLGVAVLRNKNQFAQYHVSKAFGLSLVFWGLHRANYPFLNSNFSFAPYGYYLASLLTALVSLTLLGLTIEIEEHEKGVSIARYKKFFDNSFDIMMLVDKNEKIIEANRAAERAYGYLRQEFVGKQLNTIQPSALDRSCEQLFETIHKRRDGKEVPVEVSTQLFKLNKTTIRLLIIRDISERKANEDRLIKSQEYYLSLFEQLPVLMWRVAPNGECNYVNKSWLNFTGKEAKDEYRLQWLDGIHPDDLNGFKIQYLKAIRERSSFELAFRLRRFDGVYRWMVSNGEPFLDLDGNYAGFIGTCFDVSEEREAREKIRNLQERLSITLSSINDSVIATDVKGRITFANKAAKNLLGINLTGEAFVEKIILQDKEGKVVSGVLLDRILTKNEVSSDDFRLVINEKVYPVACSSNLLVKDDGVLEGMVLVLRDITKEKEAEIRLIENERRYRATFENTGTGLMIVNKETIIELANKELENLTGYIKLELEGIMSWTQFVKPTYLDMMKEYNSQRFKGVGNPPKSYEFVLLDRHGAEHNVLCNVEQLPDSDKLIVSWVDITERRRAEDQIRYLSQHDSLTGLYNRRRLEIEIDKLDRPENLPLSVIVGDLNGLKLVNDAFGHEMGDKLLIEIANILKAATRETDVVARWGGDEFIVLLPKTTREEAETVVDKINRMCETTESEETYTIAVNISLGLDVKVTSEQQIKDVIIKAENQMYNNKVEDTVTFKDKVFQKLQKRLLLIDKDNREQLNLVSKLAIELGNNLGLSNSELEELKMVASLYDVGKIGIKEALWVTETLDEAEFEKYKRHPLIGYHIVKTFPQLAGVAEAILFHHERWDGSGYPQGLKETEIPLTARIVAILDCFSQICTTLDNVNKVEEAIEVIENRSGKEFDPDLVDAFVSYLRGRVK